MKRALYAAAGISLGLSAFFRFVLTGYGTSALAFCFAAVCFGFFAALHARKARFVRPVRIGAFILLLLGFGCFLAAEIPVFAGSHSDKDTHADYLIIMGAGVNGTTPSLSMLNRLNAACDWLAENPDGIAVVSGGKGGGDDITEAQAMFDWLTEQGIAPERILLEERATSSYENILFSLALIAANGGSTAEPVAIVSSDYHLCRVRCIANALGCQPRCVAASTRISLYVNYAMREALALWRYGILGFA